MNDNLSLYSMSEYKNNLYDTNYLVSVYSYFIVFPLVKKLYLFQF